MTVNLCLEDGRLTHGKLVEGVVVYVLRGTGLPPADKTADRDTMNRDKWILENTEVLRVNNISGNDKGSRLFHGITYDVEWRGRRLT